MTFTKGTALHDRITIDGLDYSNAFHSFGLNSDGTDVDISGFSPSGVDETLTGPKAQGFSGDVYLTPETIPFLWSIHINNTVVEVSWQKDGLVGNTCPTFHGNCQLRVFDPSNTRGNASMSPVTFKTADATGITTS